MARVRGMTQFYLPPTRLSTNRINHPAFILRRIVTVAFCAVYKYSYLLSASKCVSYFVYTISAVCCVPS